MSANAHAVRSSPFTRSAFALFVLLVVAALFMMSNILVPMSARADEAPPLDETASSDVAPANEVSLVVQEPAPVSPPAPDPVPEPVVASAPPATPVVDPVVETPTSTDVTAPATEADVEDVTDNSTDAQDPAVTNDAEPTPKVAPAAPGDELPAQPSALSGVTAEGKLFLEAVAGDFTDWTLVIYGPDNETVVEGFALELGGYYTFPVTKTGWYQMALVHPTRDSIGAGDFFIEVPEVPVVITAPKPTVDDGNTVTIPVKDGVEYFDVETGETVTGEVTLTDPGICIGARSDDPYGDKVTGGPWCFEFLPEDTVLKKHEVRFQCEAKAWYGYVLEAPVTFVRGEDGKVSPVVGDFKEVYAIKLDPEEYPVTDEDLATCPVKPVDPVDPVDPTTPVNPGGGTTTPGNPAPVNNGGGSKGTAVVKADSLAATGGDSPLGLIVGGGLLFALGLPLTLRRRRANKA